MYRVMFCLLWTKAPLQLIKNESTPIGMSLSDAEYDAWLRVHHPYHLRVTTQQDTGGGNTPTSVGNSAAASAANGTQRSPLMDLLYVSVPKTSRTKTMTTGKARVLTSAECLQEKES